MWRLSEIDDLYNLKCKAKTVRIIYTLMEAGKDANVATQEPTIGKVPAEQQPNIAFVPVRRVFTCRATKPGKITMRFYYSKPFVKVRAVQYNIEVEVTPCSRKLHYRFNEKC